MDLITKVSNDPQWRKYIEDEGADPVFYRDDRFRGLIIEDHKDFVRSPQDAARQVNDPPGRDIRKT